MATATRSTMRLTPPSLKDRQRWYLWRSDKTVEEIAAREHAAIKEVQKSIDKVESYRYLGSIEEVDARYNHAALELVDEQVSVIRRAMKAKTVRTNPVTGQDKTIDDHATQLAAAKEAREMAGVTRAKSGPAIVNNLMQQNNGVGQRVNGGLDFESRLRMLRAQQAEQLPVTVTRQLEAPKDEPSHAERIAADMQEAGLELDDDELDELSGDVDDEDSEGEVSDDDDVSDDDEDEAPQAQVSPAQDSNPDEDW